MVARAYREIRNEEQIVKELDAARLTVLAEFWNRVGVFFKFRSTRKIVAAVIFAVGGRLVWRVERCTALARNADW